MRLSTKVFAFSPCIALLAVLWSNTTHAASGVWNGTESVYWTNSANWSVSPYPSVADTASFTNAGNSRTTIDLAGLSSVKYITYDTPSVATYTIGSGGANAQSLVVADGGQITLATAAAADQVIAAAVQMQGNYTIANNSASRTLTLNAVTNTLIDRSVTFSGSGAISLLGNLSASNGTLYVNANGTGPLTLSGSNNQMRNLSVNGDNAVVNLASGSLIAFNSGDNLSASKDGVINGPGAMFLSRGSGEDFANNSVVNGKTLTVNAKLTGVTGFEYWHSSNFGTFALLGQNDFTLNVVMNAAGTLMVTNVGNQASTTSNLGAGTKVIFSSTYGGPSCVKYAGLGENSNRILEFRQSGIVEQAGPSGNLRFTTSVTSSGSPTVMLRGSTAGTGELAANVPGSVSVAKSGTGAWFLSASNTYSGATTVNAGNLIVSGSAGSIKSTSGITLNGGALVLLNTAVSNLSDRLADSVAITLNGGTLCFSNDQTSANFSETAGALMVNSGTGTVAVTPAVEGRTSALRFTSITRASGGSVNFVGADLGNSDSNRVFITGQGDGLIGSWATVNGTRYAAYSSARGVYAASPTVDIAARGYSVITNDVNLAVRISYPGESGPITLETSPVSSVGLLIQNSDTPAVVTTTSTLFRVSDLLQPAGKESLTIGTVPREGSLSTILGGGRLSLENGSTNRVLTVNANIVSNTTACGLTKVGVGTAVLAGQNTYGGATLVNGGELVFGVGNHVIGQLSVGTASFLLTNAAPTFVDVSTNSAYLGYNGEDFGRMKLAGSSSWSGFRYLKYSNQTTFVVGNYGRAVLTIQDNASVTQRLYVGNNSGSAGAVYQNGGVMHNWGGFNADARIGMTGYGYYELNSGTFTNNGSTQLGRDLTSIGILKQTGGAFQMGNVFDGQLALSRGGTGVIYTVAGTFNASAGVNVGDASDNSTVNGYAEFSVDGDARVDVNGPIYLADRNSMFAVVNLNGGFLSACQISKSPSRTGSLALMNIDGGTLRTRGSGQFFGIGTSVPDAVNIYAGGAIFDTTNLTSTVSVPLRSPAGNGVTAIGVTPRGGYIGPPMVTISGGGGTGATAVAQFNSANGNVTGLEITSRGFGYTSSPTVSLSGGGTNVQATLGGVTLGANVGGGLTKIGTGSLILAATNTYAGPTIVSNGTLFVSVPKAIPSNSVLTLAGGNVDVGATLSTVAPIRINAGVLRMPLSAQPGLLEGTVYGSFNTTDLPYTNILVQSTTRAANTAAFPPWRDNVTYVYTGYLWNRATTNVTWTFGENVDDSTLLKIDSTTVIANGNGWSMPTIGTMTLTPGPHAFEARFGNGVGGAGLVDGRNASSLSWWKTNSIGFGVDYLGRNDTNIANFVALTDPGDGSLLCVTPVTGGLTNRIDTTATVELGAAGVLELGTNTYSQTLANLRGTGIVSNGVLTVTGAIAPGGTNAVGWLTVANNAGLAGKLLTDVATDGSSDRLVVVGNINLSSLSLEIANPSQLNKQTPYTVVTCTGTRTGSFSSVTVPSSSWHVVYSPDGSVKLVFVNGMLLKLL
jgi:autotransporter-associated beta strand protein